MHVVGDGSVLGKPVREEPDQIWVLSASKALESQGSALWLPLPAQSDRHAEQTEQIMTLLVWKFEGRCICLFAAVLEILGGWELSVHLYNHKV